MIARAKCRACYCAVQAAAGIIDEDINSTKLGDRRSHHRFYRRGLTHVGAIVCRCVGAGEARTQCFNPVGGSKPFGTILAPAFARASAIPSRCHWSIR
jgi:hypothetical protein